jgi:hypothetical protein
MITVKQFMETVSYRITEGGSYGRQCYGDRAYALDSWNGEQDGYSFTMIFDTKTQEVYEVQAHDFRLGRAYRLMNPLYEKSHREEAGNRESPWDEAWEGVNYVDLESVEDWMEKSQAIARGEDYDTRVSVPVDFSDEELLQYMTMAHERDMTFNQFIEMALRQAIDRYQAEGVI